MRASTQTTLRWNLPLRWASWQNRIRLEKLQKLIDLREQSKPEEKPVIFFNVSSRLTGISLNAAYTLITSWSLRLAGIPITHFVCQAGMSYCVQGTNRENYKVPPPCNGCIKQSSILYKKSDIEWFRYQKNNELENALNDLNITELSTFDYPFTFQGKEDSSASIPLGKLVLPSLRWALRRHDLPDDKSTRFLLQEYILSAYCIAQKFDRLLNQRKPFAVVIFNGIMYPEAAACWVARKRNIRTITQEVGFQPFSVFLSDGEATAYPIKIPDNMELNPKQNERLHDYLQKRFKGKFTMAGIQFWPEMTALDEQFNQRAKQFHQIVPIFTNVIYDTSQVHANTIFSNMFEWLNQILDLIKIHPETFFVIRAHPDEMRPGTRKQSRQNVHDWIYQNKINEMSNALFIDSQEYVSSYELIQRSKFLMVYNSSIGLEATLLVIPVLCGGKARYTQYPTVFLPESAQEYLSLAEKFLNSPKIELPVEFIRNARRFLYYQLYRVSLPLDNFLERGPKAGFVQFKPFPLEQLLPENSEVLKVICNGIIHNEPFLLNENQVYLFDRQN